MRVRYAYSLANGRLKIVTKCVTVGNSLQFRFICSTMSGHSQTPGVWNSFRGVTPKPSAGMDSGLLVLGPLIRSRESTPISHLKLFFLGPPRVEIDGMPIEVDTRKAIALAAYLAVTGGPHTREALAALFWPEYDQAHARAALRRTLSTLKNALAGDWLDVDRGSVELQRTAHLWVDVEEFQRQLAACQTHGHPADETCPACLRPLAAAVALYRDDFLTGFSLRDSSNFDEWQFFQAEHLRHKLAGALEKLVRGHSAQAEFEQAIDGTRRWLALDPLHEPAHRQLMLLYAWTNRRAAALRQYRECVRILDQELGVPPLEETTRLYQAIQEHQAPPPPGEPVKAGALITAPPPPRAPAAQLPLIGRSTEWGALLDAYGAIAVDGRLMVLEGEGGIGKTRLAEEFLSWVQTRGAVTLAARCYEGETDLAYGPFVEALRAALERPDRSERLAQMPAYRLAEVARLLPELADTRPGLPSISPIDGPDAQRRFFEGLSQVLLELGQGPSPGVLFFDDVHWADEASLDFLTYLVRRLRGHPLCLLVTWRKEQIPPAGHLRQLRAEARRAGLATLLPLARLDQPAVLDLVQATMAAAGDQAEALGERLYHETEGLPFFLAEYLAEVARSGQATPQGDWPLTGGGRDLLRSRLARVSETGWQLLTTAAVIGRSFDYNTLRAASGRSDEETIAALEELIDQGIVLEVNGGDESGRLIYDFSHEKLRALVFEQSSLARRRLLHRRVAEALAGHGRSQRDIDASAGQIAQHYRLAGQEKEAARYHKLAGEHAHRLYANAEALAHFEMALALGHPEAAALHEAIGDLQTLKGEYSAALASYETAAALSNPETLAEVEHKLGNLYQRQGAWELAEGRYRAALAASSVEENAGRQARLYADWTLAAHHLGQSGRAQELAQRALELAEAAGDAQALAQAHNILGILASGQNRLEQAQDHLRRSLALAETLGDSSARIAALNNLALVERARGNLDQALALTETALEGCVSQGDRHREAALRNNLADLLHAAGRPEAAMAQLKQAVIIFAEIGAAGDAPRPEIWKLVEW